MDIKKIKEQLPYVDGVVECGDSRQIKWLMSTDTLYGAVEPNSNEGTINRVPLMLYKNIIFLADKIDENGSVILDHKEKIQNLIEDFEFFGGEEFAKKIEDIINEQKELGETNLELIIKIDDIDKGLVKLEDMVGDSSEFIDMQGSIVENIEYIASVLGNKENEDFYGNEDIGKPSSGIFDTLKSVTVTVNSMRTKVSEFENTLNNMELLVNGHSMSLEGLKEIVGGKVKISIEDKEVELSHDDAIEQIFSATKLNTIQIKRLGESIEGFADDIKQNKEGLETVNNGLEEHKKKYTTFAETTEQKSNSMDGRVSNVEESTKEIPSMKSSIEDHEKRIGANVLLLDNIQNEITVINGEQSTINDKISTMGSNISTNSDDIEELDVYIKALNDDIKQKITDINERLDNVPDTAYIDEKISESDASIKKVSDDLSSYKESIDESIKELTDEMRKDVEHLKGENLKLGESITKLALDYDNKINEMNQEIEEIKRKVGISGVEE